MAQLIEVRVPDMGNFSEVGVIDVLVKPGDTVAVDTPLVTLETEKATMDVPSTAAGVVAEVLVRKGGKIRAGAGVVKVETGTSTATNAEPSKAAASPAPAPVPAPPPAP